MLVGQLLKSRDVARFIVAPSGYGKSYLALEYAETMKFWVHTFWVNAQSPCFVRDLDDGSIAACILESDGEASLVVFDDVPALDADRCGKFSQAIDALLAEGCEVIVTCAPACDTVGALQGDRLLVDAESLLLSDDELDEIRSIDERSYKPSAQVGPALRVPLLAWSHAPNRGELFVKAALSEELPGDLLLVMGSAFALQKGALSDFSSLGISEQHVFEEVSCSYPHLGIDMEAGSFESPSVEVAELAIALRTCLPKLVDRSSFGSAKELVGAWVAVLLHNGRAERACSLIQEVYPRVYRARWIIENARELIRQACFVSTYRLITAQKDCNGDTRLRLGALESLCRRLLGDEEGALHCAKKSAFSEVSPEDARTLGLLVITRLNGGIVSEQAREILSRQVKAAEGKPLRHLSRWELLGTAWQARENGLEDMTRLWGELSECQVDDDVLCICASWLFGLYRDASEEAQQDGLLVRHRAERYVRERLLEKARLNVVDYYLASAGLAMEEAHAYGMPFEGGALETISLVHLRQMEMSVLSQRRYFEDDLRLERARRIDWVSTHPALLSSKSVPGAAEAPERAIPLLTLKMFGCFGVSIGGVPVPYSRFRRQNTRALLVLLAVNQGRELSRDVVARAIWPKSEPGVAHKNFYSVWSLLRKALSLPDGTCPYLIRHRYGCSLDSRFVQSDVARFNEICRELLFGAPNVEHWSLLFTEIDRDFSSDLMPAEEGNDLIDQARNDYRTRLVDALVTATGSILDAEIPQWGVWFARSAIHHDETREDAYAALMRAQIAGNQRTAAMMTYLKCRRVLSDTLGIDPSPEMTALYEGLLDADQ